MSLTLPQNELAALLCVTPRTVSTLTAQGVIPREPDGSYALEKAIPAYITHKGADFEMRRERIAAMRQQTASQAMRTRRALGDLVSSGELKFFTECLEDIAVRVWQAMASTVYHGLAGVVPDADRMRITSRTDELAKDELAVLKMRLQAMLAGARGDFHDDERLDAVLQHLAGEEPATKKPAAKKAKK